MFGYIQFDFIRKVSPKRTDFSFPSSQMFFDGVVGFDQRRDVLACWKITVYISCLVLHNQL